MVSKAAVEENSAILWRISRFLAAAVPQSVICAEYRWVDTPKQKGPGQ
jgi:hypothetical protein